MATDWSQFTPTAQTPPHQVDWSQFAPADAPSPTPPTMTTTVVHGPAVTQPSIGERLGAAFKAIPSAGDIVDALGSKVADVFAPSGAEHLAPVTKADIARDEFRKRAQAATAADVANPAFGLNVAAQIAQGLHTAPAAVVAANQPAPIDYRNLDPSGPGEAANAFMQARVAGLTSDIAKPLGYGLAGLVNLPNLVAGGDLYHAPQDAIFKATEAITNPADEAVAAAQKTSPLGAGVAQLQNALNLFEVLPEADTGKIGAKLGLFAEKHPGTAAKLADFLSHAAQNTPRAALAGGVPQSVGAAQQTLRNGGTLGQAFGEAGANLGTGTAGFMLPSSLGGNPVLRALGGASVQAGANYGAQAASHAIAPQVFPQAQVSPESAALGMLFGLLGGRGETAPRAPGNVPALEGIATQMRAELKAQGLSDAQIDAILNPAPEAATPALPAPVVNVDTAGNAATQAQTDAAQRATQARGQELGLTPDVERAQAARNAPELARQEQERVNPSPPTVDDMLSELEGRQRAPEGAPAPEPGIPAPAPEKVDAYFSNLPKEIGWEQRGGGILRGPGSGLSAGDHAMAEDRSGPVIGRTPWVPKVGGDGQPSAFWRMRPDATLTEAQAHEAFRKVAAGEPLRPIEQRFIDYSRQTAHDYAQAEAEDTARFEAEQNDADDLERQRAREELRHENARFATADHGEAFSVAQWARRAREAGMTLDEALAALGEGDNGTRISNLAKAIADKENTRGTDTQPDGLGSEGGVREGSEGQAAAVRESPGEVGQAGQTGADLFPSATAREQVTAAERTKDDARNGNTGRVIPGFEGTDLGATPHGEAPEQARIPEDDTPPPPLDIRYGKRKAVSMLPPRQSVPDVRELSPDDLTKAERDAFAGQRAEAQLPEQQRQENRDRGETEARERGLRGAIGDAIGDQRIQFAHDEEGLPPEVKSRLRPLKEGNVRHALFDPKTGDTWIFTKRVRTPEQAAWAAAHEIAGHKGFRALVSDRAGVKVGGRTPTEALNSATDLALQNPTVAKLAEAIGKQRGSGNRRLMAEEGIAELAAAARTGRWDEIAKRYGVDVPKAVREGVQGAVRNFVARLRRILNAINAKLTGKPETFSDEQVHQLLADSFAAAKQGGDENAIGEPSPLDSSAPEDRAGEESHGASGPAGVTGVKNAQTKAERAARGLGELDVEGRRSFGQVWDNAEAKLRDNPHTGQALAQHIIEKPRALSAEETAILTQDRARIAIQRRAAAEDVNKAVAGGDASGEAIARAKLKLANDEMDVSDKAARASGYEQGLGLAIRAKMQALDYSLDSMEQRLAAAKGKPLDERDLKTLRDLHEQMQAKDAELAGRTEAKQARQKETKAKLQEQLRLFKDQLNQAESRRDAMRQKQLRKQIAQLARRIVEGDYSKVQRTPFQYNEETNRLLADRNFLRKKFDRLAAQAEYNNRSWAYKRMSTFLALRRAIILSGFTTLFKLSAAASYRIGLSPVEHAVQGALGKLPGLRGVAKKAPLEGRFSGAAEGHAMGQTFNKQTLRDMRDKFLHGENMNDLLYGKNKASLHSWLDMVGHVHAALKTPAERNAFSRAQKMGAEHEAKRAADSGMTPEQVAAHMEDPRTQGVIDMRAYEESQRAVFKNKNAMVKGFDALKRAIPSIAPVLDYIFPIVNVPSNYLGEAMSYAGGAAKAAKVLMDAKGVQTLTPDQADYIMRALGKQTIGAALGAVGWLFYKQIGSFYQSGDNKRKVPEDGTAFGFPKWALDTPAAMMLTIGANLHRISDGIPNKNGSIRKGTGTPGNAVLNTARGVWNEIPFVREPQQLASEFSSTDALTQGIGNEAAHNFIPPDVRKLAAHMDDNTPRKPKSFTDEIKMGVPGLRSEVPRKH